jgi:hypothetical protein
MKHAREIRVQELFHEPLGGKLHRIRDLNRERESNRIVHPYLRFSEAIEGREQSPGASLQEGGAEGERFRLGQSIR